MCSKSYKECKYALKKKWIIINTINRKLELDESDYDFDEYEQIYDWLY